MQASVTAIGTYNSVPAFEYEIRDDVGNLMGFDLVIVHPRADETWDDMAAFAQQFLRKRAMWWELAPVQQRETRLGGKRLTEYVKGSATAPRLNGTRVAAKHRVTVTVTKAEAVAWYADISAGEVVV